MSQERPNCIYCNASNVIMKNGVDWKCKNCGKHWRRNYKLDNLPEMKLTEYQKGWISALIDGEGYIGLYKAGDKSKHTCRRGRGNFKWEVRCAISMTNHEIIQKVREVLGLKMKPVDKKRYPERWKNIPKKCWTVNICPNKLRILLPQIELIVKRRHRVLMLETLDLLRKNQTTARWRGTAEQDQRLEEIHKEFRQLNKRGQ